MVSQTPDLIRAYRFSLVLMIQIVPIEFNRSKNGLLHQGRLDITFSLTGILL